MASSSALRKALISHVRASHGTKATHYDTTRYLVITNMSQQGTRILVASILQDDGVGTTGFF